MTVENTNGSASRKNKKARWPKDLGRWDVVYIEWVDSVSHGDNAWEEIHPASTNDEDMRIFHAGLVYRVTDESLTVVTATDKENQMAGRFQIPRVAIRKIKKIRI